VDLSTANASTLLHAVDAHGFIVLVNHGLSGQRATSLLEDALQPGASTAGWRRSKAGYGPGLQYREHTEGENYSTAEGSYRNGGREDFVFYDPSVPMRKQPVTHSIHRAHRRSGSKTWNKSAQTPPRARRLPITIVAFKL